MSNALVIIPTYNEKENIVQIIRAVMEQPKDFHLLIIDDNSPDGTAELVKGVQRIYNFPSETKVHLIQRAGKLGLGTAYIEGFKFALNQGYDSFWKWMPIFPTIRPTWYSLMVCNKEGKSFFQPTR